MSKKQQKRVRVEGCSFVLLEGSARHTFYLWIVQFPNKGIYKYLDFYTEHNEHVGLADAAMAEVCSREMGLQVKGAIVGEWRLRLKIVSGVGNLQSKYARV